MIGSFYHDRICWSMKSLTEPIGPILLTHGKTVISKRWQAQDISDVPVMTPHEIMDVSLDVDMPEFLDETQQLTGCNLPWAEDHFQERVSGEPLNPPPSHEWWPFARKNNDEHRIQDLFSHTYPERFWPKLAHSNNYGHAEADGENMRGIRYSYGDLGDVVNMLRQDPHTRQAYLPVFFPEDTGATADQRIPCTLGYQFMVREGRMNIKYDIRSCDFLRHFPDDVYMAMRLAHWVREQTNPEVLLGRLFMTIGSFHVFQGDLPRMRMLYG